MFDKTYWEWGGKAGASPQGYEVGVSRCTWRAFPGMVTLSVLNQFPRGVAWVNLKLSTEIACAFFAVRLSAHRFGIAPQGWSVTFNFPSNPKNYILF